MPTDSSGVHSLPPGYLAQTGETIQASQHNPPLEDLSTAVTGRLPRSGVAPMTGPLKLTDGATGSPSLAFNNAATSGIYKTTTGFGLVVSGALVAEINSSGFVMAKTALFKDGGDTASATALTLGDGNVFNITGTAAITSIATKGVGAVAMLRFADILTLTHHSADLILHGSANITTAAGDWAVFEEYAAGDWRMLSYHRGDGRALVGTLPRGYIDGCIISNGTDATNDINIGSGVCRDSTDAVNIAVPALTGKQLDANWAPGSAAGMRDSSDGIDNATYHIYAVRTAASAVGDIYATTQATVSGALTALQAESGGSAYVYGRMIASIVRVDDAIIPFIQSSIVQDYFEYKTPALDHSSQPASLSAITITLVSLPVGLVLRADIGAALNAVTTGGGLTGWFSSLASTDVQPSLNMYHVTSAAGSNGHAITRMPVETNTSGQIRGRLSHSGANDAIRAFTYGYWHPRGRA